ncbi:SPOSA6832_02389 [Sporobolomyces salmonicolor]|uniref:SPOSA6832_02389-mRNA-1:cds n=1 Tax=Sporidiobolus salmonicolor TaxID=5005 RepID=A0A0D6ELF5_SPOSA|nr:SPOSA6832_02389 [Sporobolomyces salmonicolor]
MPGSVRLLLVGLVLGCLSAVYPLLPAYLPSSVSARLPFLPSHSLPDTAKTWQSLHRYQSTIPISPNHEHSPEARWEEELERQLRFGSKEGGREIDKELKRVQREIERRTEQAGEENKINEGLPVYFVEQREPIHAAGPGPTPAPLVALLTRTPADYSPDSLAALGREINSLVPLSLIVLAPYPTTAQHLLIATSPVLLPTSHRSSAKLAQSLLTSFAHLPPSGVPAASSSLLSLPSSTSQLLASLNLDRETQVVFVALPVPSDEERERLGEGWETEQWWDVGKVLHELRHTQDGMRTVVMAVGSATPEKVSPSFPTLLLSTLAHHTSHAREVSLAALYASSSGSGKPRKAVPKARVGLYVAVAAAGEGEGERLEGGAGWRFGGLPLR